MNALLLRAAAAVIAAATFVGANAYVVGHPKNPAAPLQPPAADDLALRQATPKPTPAPSGKPTATPRGTPAPKITLQPGVRETALPGVTYTHVS